MLKLVPAKISQSIGRQTMSLKDQSPRLMFALGIVGTIGSTILACRATLKLPQKLDEFKQEVDGVKEMPIANGYTQRDNNKDLAYVYTKNSIELLKLYAPAVLLGSASIAALTSSHVTLSRRNASLTSAYAALHASYEAYRERVREDVGEEKERDYHLGVRNEKVTIDGKVQDVKVVDPTKTSVYARFFDEASPNWQKNPEINRLFIQCQQNYANNLLHSRGHVFLNEVYDMLGLPRSSAGQVVGWMVGDNGDNYIDFGIFEAANSRFVNGWERSILLDFNVDGVIYNKL